MYALQTILVPVDGSPPSIAALEFAVALVADGLATVDVLHVEAPDEFDIGSTTSLAPAVRREVEQAMDEAVERLQGKLGARLTWRIMTGDPVRKIIETANDGHYDLIVIGTHGRMGRLHALLGSVAESVVRNAPCPVLTVRDSGGEVQSFAERRHGEQSLADQVTRPHRPG